MKKIVLLLFISLFFNCFELPDFQAKYDITGKNWNSITMSSTYIDKFDPIIFEDDRSITLNLLPFTGNFSNLSGFYTQNENLISFTIEGIYTNGGSTSNFTITCTDAQLNELGDKIEGFYLIEFVSDFTAENGTIEFNSFI